MQSEEKGWHKEHSGDGGTMPSVGLGVIQKAGSTDSRRARQGTTEASSYGGTSSLLGREQLHN